MKALILCFFLYFSLSHLSGCSAQLKKVYVGDSKSESILRTQDGEQVMCSDKKFDNMICLPKEDFLEILKKIK